MRAVSLVSPGCMGAVDLPEPEPPGPGEALVRVHCIGVCGTDLHAFRGRQPYFTYPRVVGHELGVEVVEVGEGVGNVLPGDRCAVEPYLNCGRCVACRRGRPNCCTELRTLGVHVDGGMCERFVIPADKLHPSQTLSFEQLALVETLAIGAHAVARSGLEATDTALVLGAGPIGLAVAQFALLANSRVIVSERNPDRLELCRQVLGIADTIGPEDDTASRVRDLTAGEMAHVVFDATGSPESMTGALRYVAHTGRLVFVSLVQADIPIHDPDFHKREATLYATRNSTATDFQRIVPLMECGVVSVDAWITHRLSLDDVPATFPSLIDTASGVVKAVVRV